MRGRNRAPHLSLVMNPYEPTALGKPVAWPRRVDAAVLVPIPRAAMRADLGLAPHAPLPFHGEDLWGCYELSWLDVHGKPVQALAELRVSAASARLIESKSLKLYLNGYAGERMADADAVRARIAQDLAVAAGDTVHVALLESAVWGRLRLHAAPGEALDELQIAPASYGPPQPQLLRRASAGRVHETLHSTLFRSNCPVTGQPDWATVVVDYAGPALDHAALLAYLVSYREHAAFHEQCVERIWLDLMQHGACVALTVFARFTRRGGLDINPLRSSDAAARLPAWQRYTQQ